MFLFLSCDCVKINPNFKIHSFLIGWHSNLEIFTCEIWQDLTWKKGLNIVQKRWKSEFKIVKTNSNPMCGSRNCLQIFKPYSVFNSIVSYQGFWNLILNLFISRNLNIGEKEMERKAVKTKWIPMNLWSSDADQCVTCALGPKVILLLLWPSWSPTEKRKLRSA